MNCSSETVKMGEPDRHASPPGNRLKAEPMADGQGEAGGHAHICGRSHAKARMAEMSGLGEEAKTWHI